MVGACGGSDEASTSDEAAVSDGDTESSSGDDAPAGVSTATLTLDGVEYVFDDFSQCLVFGERFMSGDATDPSGAELDFSYEEPDLEADGEGSEYANFIELELDDGAQSWKSGSISGSLPQEWGTLELSKNGNTLDGVGTFVDGNFGDSEPVAGEFSVTCA